jgi:glyoxylase-like metal-dependent hydrolase (beta-lactamase superfamily II)
MLPPHYTFVERGVLHSNSVVVHGEDGFVLFDTGYVTGVEDLARAITEQAGRQLGELKMIVNTHAHPDHTGGNAWLAARTGCAIAMSDIDRMLVESGDPVTLMREWADLRCPPFEVTRALSPGDAFEAVGHRLVAVEAAGHAAGEISFYDRADGVLICGDLLWQAGFSNVVPLVEGVGGLVRHERSLRALLDLAVEVAIPGHGGLIVGAAAVRARIEETIATIRFYRAHPDRWAAAALRSFLVMHVLVHGTVERGDFVARCRRSLWFREQAARHFANEVELLERLLAELIDKHVLVSEGTTIRCTLRA